MSLARKAKAVVVIFGYTAPSLAEQLGVDPQRVAPFQADADSITSMYRRGILNGRDAHIARKRLTVLLQREFDR